MHRFDTFTDLRVNSGDRQGEITLWPSFTDIMTVVLMIFMLTMVVVIIKNTTLGRALLYSEGQRRQIQEALQAGEKDRAGLKIAMADLEEKLRQKQMAVLLREDEIKLLQQELEGKTAQIAAFEGQTLELKNKIDALQAGVDAARAGAAESEQKAAELTRQYEARLAEMQAASETALAVLSESKTREIEEYNRKVLSLLSRLREKEAAILTLAADQLHRQLGALREKWQDQLYVKVVIPEDSGLTYNEAWTFTKDILSRYDYYYRD